ncbi:MAG: SnoaL-like domain-containing protein [Marinibacterium sp.]
MNVKEVAAELVAGCREGREAANLDVLYAPDAVSVEATEQGMPREARGLDAIRGKHDWWTTNMEVTGGNISDPMIHGDDRFAVIFEVQGKEKASGKTFDMKEVAVYTVQGGKIVREEFFY